jgi:hypothetical protein
VPGEDVLETDAAAGSGVLETDAPAGGILVVSSAGGEQR